MKHGFARIAVGIPRVAVGDCEKNLEEIKGLIDEADQVKADVLLLPELALTGATCGDLFLQSALLEGAELALCELLDYTTDRRPLIAVGLPVKAGTQLYNCAAVISRGKLLGLVPKQGGLSRLFSPLGRIVGTEVSLCGQDVPFSADLRFCCGDYPALTVGVESGGEVFGLHGQRGAGVRLNLSAVPEQVGTRDRRVQAVRAHSARCAAAVAYAGAGLGESTTDFVFAGGGLLAENGELLFETERLSPKRLLSYGDVDLELLESERLRQDAGRVLTPSVPCTNIPFQLDTVTRPLARTVDPMPFLPGGDRHEHFTEILALQAAALRRRLKASKAQTAVIGVSGGLDSTLALLVAVTACDWMERSRTHILGVTMPGFGTTTGTYENAVRLMDELGVTKREIPIDDSVTQHFHDIDHDPQVHDITYENAQARERTQILMDLANQTKGLVIGTGNLSESALGWSTYGGDHLSMYAVNCGIPKTLVSAMVEWLSESGRYSAAVSAALRDIAATPISPELLPPDAAGKTAQKTEDVVGPYVLHDFFLYYVIRHGFSPAKIVYLAEHAFKDRFDQAAIRKWLTVFYRRFFSQQFKRSCMPDGPQVGPVSLSPRTGWRMPSDAAAAMWLRELEEL